MAETLTIKVSEDDAATLREWAANAEVALEVLLDEAIRNYMKDVRADHADLAEREKGPFYTLEEVKAHLAEERRHLRAQAAE